MMRRSYLSGFSWLWATREREPIIAAQQRRRLTASAVLLLVMAIVVIIARMDVHAPEIARVPVILGLVLTPVVSHAYIVIARRLIQRPEAMIVTAARAASSTAAALVEITAAAQVEHRLAVARVLLGLRAARAARRASVDALRASACVPFAALAPRVTSRSLRAAA
jgi:hypothetical protein